MSLSYDFIKGRASTSAASFHPLLFAGSYADSSMCLTLEYAQNRGVQHWIVKNEDYTPLVAKMYKLIHSGQADKAKRHLPPEKVYPVTSEIGKRILIDA